MKLSTPPRPSETRMVDSDTRKPLSFLARMEGSDPGAMPTTCPKAMANAAHEALAGNLDDAHFWLRYAELVAEHVGSTGTVKRAA